jgi:ribosomal protein L15
MAGRAQFRGRVGAGPTGGEGQDGQQNRIDSVGCLAQRPPNQLGRRITATIARDSTHSNTDKQRALTI